MTNAHFKLPNVVNLVSKSDLKIHLKIPKNLQSMTTSVSIEIKSIFKYILSEYSSSSKKYETPWMLNIPQNVNEARSIYLEGKYAVLTNLPYQEIIPVKIKGVTFVFWKNLSYYYICIVHNKSFLMVHNTLYYIF